MAKDFDASLLRTFLACVRLGGISRAAVALGRSQPTVSEQIRRLEDIAGGALLRRTNMGVELTERGERLHPFAQEIVGLSEEAQRALDGPDTRVERCGIAVLEDLWDARFTSLLQTLRAAHPSSRIELVALPGPQMRDAVRTRRVDLLLGDPAGIDLPIDSIWRERFQWTAAEGFDVSIRPLPIVLCSAPCRWRAAILETLDRAGTAWRVAFESTSFSGVAAAVRGGSGVAALLPGDLSSGLRRLDSTPRMPALPEAELALQRHPDPAFPRLAADVAVLLRRLMDARAQAAVGLQAAGDPTPSGPGAALSIMAG